jgi:rare lipoprotein A
VSGHHAEGHNRPFWRSRPFVTGAAVAVAAVLVVSAFAAMRVGASPPRKHRDVAVAATSTASPGASPSPSSDRPDERADRSGIRAAPTPTVKPPSASPRPSRTPATGGGSGTCQASFYSDGQRTANGEVFNPNGFTAAHRTLKFNTMLRVTNVANGKSVVVRINDRGPFAANRCLDLTRAAFASIASLNAGVATVRYEVVG